MKNITSVSQVEEWNPRYNQDSNWLSVKADWKNAGGTNVSPDVTRSFVYKTPEEWQALLDEQARLRAAAEAAREAALLAQWKLDHPEAVVAEGMSTTMKVIIGASIGVVAIVAGVLIYKNR